MIWFLFSVGKVSCGLSDDPLIQELEYKNNSLNMFFFYLQKPIQSNDAQQPPPPQGSGNVKYVSIKEEFSK